MSHARPTVAGGRPSSTVRAQTNAAFYQATLPTASCPCNSMRESMGIRCAACFTRKTRLGLTSAFCPQRRDHHARLPRAPRGGPGAAPARDSTPGQIHLHFGRPGGWRLLQLCDLLGGSLRDGPGHGALGPAVPALPWKSNSRRSSPPHMQWSTVESSTKWSGSWKSPFT